MAEASLTLQPGEIAALVGPGAEPLARILLGLTPPAGGSIAGPAWTGALQPLPARFNPRPFLTVEENIALVMRNSGALTTADPDRVSLHAAWLASLFGLGHHRTALPDGLTGSERCLLAAAASVARNHAVSVLRSPTAGLDTAGEAYVCRALHHLAATGRAFFLLPSSFAEARTLATSVIVVSRDGAVHQSIASFMASHSPSVIAQEAPTAPVLVTVHTGA